MNELWLGENLSSSLLLLVRRWAEFLQRYRKNINIEGLKVKNLTDIKRIFRRVGVDLYTTKSTSDTRISNSAVNEAFLRSNEGLILRVLVEAILAFFSRFQPYSEFKVYFYIVRMHLDSEQGTHSVHSPLKTL